MKNNRKGLKTSESVSLKNIKIMDDFWSEKINLIKDTVIPYQWEVLNDRVEEAEPSHVMKNLRIAAGLEEGEFHGFFFQDSDLAKWLEAAAYILEANPDKELEKTADEAIELIGMAQQEDGYLNSYVTITDPKKRWTNLEECHELYTAGHFIEAGVAYYEATGKDNLLKIVCKFADYIDSVFGEEPKKRKGYDGHQEIELALMRLYAVTGIERYRKLAKYFIDERGKEPYYFIKEWEDRDRISAWSNQKNDSPENRRHYIQGHLPVREQKEAVGHAVRVVYMLAGMADTAESYHDEELLNACRTLWNNIITKQMYITGGIGATHSGEAFTFDYDLPNDTVYAETCASIGLIFFAQRMLTIEHKSCYADVIERALFNIVTGSMSSDGKHYFYVNPLEVLPEACYKNPEKNHVKPIRQKWFSCACCPPNVARILASLGSYIYTVNENTIYIDQFIGSEIQEEIGGRKVFLKQTSNYPWDGEINFTLNLQEPAELLVALRIPGWCKGAELSVDGEKVELLGIMKDGYAVISRVWNSENRIKLIMPMPVEKMKANPKVRANAGKFTIQRGPVVYCIEEADNGANLSAISIDKDAEVNIVHDESLPKDAAVLMVEGFRDKDWESGERLYQSISDCMQEEEKISVKAVPYCMWGNRGQGEMLVWIRLRDKK